MWLPIGDQFLKCSSLEKLGAKVSNVYIKNDRKTYIKIDLNGWYSCDITEI